MRNLMIVTLVASGLALSACSQATQDQAKATADQAAADAQAAADKAKADAEAAASSMTTEAKATPQAEEGLTYAKKIRPKEARIRWDKPAAEVDRKIRGLSPFPGAWFELPTDKGPVRVKALLSRLEDGQGAPGRVLDDALLISCGEGAVRLLRVQREGKGPQDAEAFLRGAPVAAGTELA